MSGFTSILIKNLFFGSRDPSKGAALLASTKTYTTVKEIVRADGTQRVRIYQGGNDAFGGVVEDRRNEDGEWSPFHFIGAGCVYDSPQAVEEEAKSTVPWLHA